MLQYDIDVVIKDATRSKRLSSRDDIGQAFQFMVNGGVDGG